MYSSSLIKNEIIEQLAEFGARFPTLWSTSELHGYVGALKYFEVLSRRAVVLQSIGFGLGRNPDGLQLTHEQQCAFLDDEFLLQKLQAEANPVIKLVDGKVSWADEVADDR